MDSVIKILNSKFENANFFYELDNSLGKFVVFVNDYNLYKSKKFNNISKVLRKKFKKQKFFFAYLKFQS